MSIQELHYDFKIKQNRVDTLANFDFNSAQIDWLLNEAQSIFIKQRFTQYNPHKEGFESTQKRSDDLSTLVVKFPLQPSINISSTSDIFEVNLDSLEYDYLFLLGGTASTITPCSMEIPLKFIQNDDLRETLRDPFNKPSSEFIPYNFGLSSDGTSRSIYLYGGDLILSSVKIEYLRRPPKMSFGNYTYIDGITYAEQTSILPEHTHSEIVDIAVQLAAINTDNPQLLQLRSAKVAIHE